MENLACAICLEGKFLQGTENGPLAFRGADFDVMGHADRKGGINNRPHEQVQNPTAKQPLQCPSSLRVTLLYLMEYGNVQCLWHDPA